MYAPSVKTLQSLHLSEYDAKMLRSTLKRCDGTNESIELCLLVADHVLNTYGVEGICNTVGSIGFTYCNTGETYTRTLGYDSKSKRFIVCSWGDWLESKERQGYKFS